MMYVVRNEHSSKGKGKDHEMKQQKWSKAQSKKKKWSKAAKISLLGSNDGAFSSSIIKRLAPVESCKPTNTL